MKLYSVKRTYTDLILVKEGERIDDVYRDLEFSLDNDLPKVDFSELQPTSPIPWGWHASCLVWATGETEMTLGEALAEMGRIEKGEPDPNQGVLPGMERRGEPA